MNEEEIRRYRESIGLYGVLLQDLGVVLKDVARSLTPRPVKNKMLELMDGIRAQTATNQASGNPGNPTPNQGAQGQTNSSRGLFGFAGFLRPKPPQQQPPPPPTEEQKRQMVEEQKLKELEDKQLAVKAKRKRLDNMRGLSVDRT